VDYESDVKIVARAAIARYGRSAAEVMQERADAHLRANELQGHEFWNKVAAAIRELTAGGTA
jgi:hypothetical protein